MRGHYKRKLSRDMAQLLIQYDFKDSLENNIVNLSKKLSLNEEYIFKSMRKLNGIVFVENANDFRIFNHTGNNNSLKLNRLFIEVTDVCNLKCIHCYKGSSGCQNLSFEDYKKVLEYFKSSSFFRVDITGGEPFINPEIMNILRYSVEQGYLVNIFTNGTLITKEIAEKLAEFNIQKLYISLDSSSPEKHNAIRGNNSSFQKTIDAIKAVRKVGIPVIINATIFENDLCELRSLIDLSKSLRVSLRVCPVLNIGNGKNVKRVTDDASIRALIMTLDGKISIDKTKAYVGPACGAGTSMLYIHPNGDVSICPTLSKSQLIDLSIGNINIDSYYQIMNRFVNLKNAGSIECEKKECVHYNYCGGGCRSRAFINEGSLDAPDFISCKLYDSLFQDE